MEQKNKLLTQLAREGWLHAPRHGHYTLGPRALAELRAIVLDNVSDSRKAALRAEVF